MDITSDDLVLDFKGAMRRLAASVTVISVKNGDKRHGMTATAVTSVSMDPPSLLICVNRKTWLHSLLDDADGFCVNVLHHEHKDVSHAFAGGLEGDERFRIAEWASNDHGVPYLVGAQSNIFCNKKLVTPYASHSIIVGEVSDVKLRPDISPLVFRDGSYAMCANI
jgi:flavin reductase (DIM6/NTAB) family NADH-FMN oxidoreductase RutF